MNNQHKGKRHWWEYLFLIIPLMIFVLLVYYNPDLKKQVKENRAAINPTTDESSSFSFSNNEKTDNLRSSSASIQSVSSASRLSSSPSKSSTINRPIKEPISKEVSLGDMKSKKIALTFDGGASAEQAPKILSILKNNNVHSTFFTTGLWAEKNKDVIKQIIKEGHTLGNHTYDHQELTKLTDEAIVNQLAKAESIIRSIVPGTTTKPYFRPPYGDRNAHVLEVAGDAGYQSIYWTVDALDWQENATESSVKKKIFDNVKNGAIILMHVGDNITPAVLDEVIKQLKSDGYLLVTIDELLEN